MKADDETSSAAEDQRDLADAEHLSTPSPDTSEYNSENDVELEGSSVAEEESAAPGDDDDDSDDDGDDGEYLDDFDDGMGDEMNRGKSNNRGDTAAAAADFMHQVDMAVC